MLVGGELGNDTADLLEEQAREIENLRYVCAEAYQFAGAYNAPVEVLDNLSAAAIGEPIPHKSYLPIGEPPEIKKLRAALVESAKLIETMRHRGMFDDNLYAPIDAVLTRCKDVLGNV